MALADDEVIGHVLYTPVELEPAPAKPLTVLGLGPMAVHPDHQGGVTVHYHLAYSDTHQ